MLNGTPLNIGISPQKPEKLDDSALREHLLGRQQRELAAVEVEHHLWRTKDLTHPCSRPITFVNALGEQGTKDLEVRIVSKILGHL